MRTFLLRLLASAVLTLMLLAGGATAASAAPQTFDDPDDGISMFWPHGYKELDVRRVILDQADGKTGVGISIEQDEVFSQNDTLILFIDANDDGKSDSFVSFYGFANGTYSALAATTRDSDVDCQRTVNHGEPFTDEGKAMPAPDADGWLTFTTSVPTARLGGATTFRWGVYAWNDSYSPRPAYDYAPNAANPRGDGNAVATSDPDGCDANRDGDYGDEPVNQGAWPVRMSGGALFGAKPATDQQQPQAPDEQATTTGPPAPKAAPAYTGPLAAVFDALGTKKSARIRPWALACSPERSDQTCKKKAKFDRSESEVGDVENFFKRRGMYVRVVTRPVKLAEISVKRGRSAAKFMEAKGKGMDIVYQSIKPGTTIESSVLDPKRLVVEYWDPQEAAALELEKRGTGCQYDKGHKRKRVSDSRLRDHFWGTPPEIAQDMLKDAGCDFTVKTVKAAGTERAKVVGAAWREGTSTIALKVHRPVATDLVLTVREDPAKVKNADDPAIGDDGAMPWGQYSYLTAQVTERRTGRLVKGAKVWWLGQRKTTDGNGDVTFRRKPPYVGSFLLYASYGKAAEVEGFREIRVAQRKTSGFRTLTGRFMAWNKSKKDFVGTSADMARSRKLRVVPALMGSGLTGPAITIATVKQDTVLGFVGDRLHTGQHNVVEVDNRNVLVAAAPGTILLSGGQTQGISTADNPYGQAGNLLGAVVTPLAIGIAHKRGSVDSILPADVKQRITATAIQLQSDGVKLPISTLISDKGLGVISTGGGNVISSGGLNVIATGGGNIISRDGAGLTRSALGSLIGQAGGNIISSDGASIISRDSAGIISRDGAGVISSGGLNVISSGGLNVISTGGGNVISSGGLNMMPVHGGTPLIGQAGGNILSDNGGG